MSILFFDTETNGFYEARLDLNDPRQQHMVQLAAILTDDQGKVQASFKTLIRPERDDDLKFIMHPNAELAHGISVEQCDKFGLPPGSLPALLRAGVRRRARRDGGCAGVP